MIQDLNSILTELGTVLIGSGSPIKGYDIYLAERPTQPGKADYPWVDILALEQTYNYDITTLTIIETDIVLRIYSKATDPSTSSLLASQEELNDVRDWIVDTITSYAHSEPGTYMWWRLLSSSRIYLEKSSKDASVVDIFCKVQYRRNR